MPSRKLEKLAANSAVTMMTYPYYLLCPGGWFGSGGGSDFGGGVGSAV
jgi:hypothetical protein